METLPIDSIKTGDLLVVQTNSWLANAIQWFQGLKNKQFGKYNHAMVAWWVYGELFVTEAIGTGVVATRFETYMQNSRYKSIMLLRPNYDVDGVSIGKYMLSFLGRTRYDFIDLVFYQSVRFLTSKWLGGNKDDKRFICGEWSAHVANSCKTDVIPNETEVAPLDLCLNSNFTHFIVK